MINLHLDIETYSETDLKKHGVYKYAECTSFEILMISYAFDDEPVSIVDLKQGEQMPKRLSDALTDPTVLKWAHNALFERVCLTAFGIIIPINQIRCTAVLCGFSGYPMALGDVSKEMELGTYGKSSTGTALIRYFCVPCKPTKTNGGRTRNLPHHAPEKWIEFLAYCVQDTVAERKIENNLSYVVVPQWEKDAYVQDQEINDRGVRVDWDLIQNALSIDAENKAAIRDELIELTGLANPNSIQQLAGWLSDHFNRKIKKLDKEAVLLLLDENCSDAVNAVLLLKQKLAKTSISKYKAAFRYRCNDGRCRGLFQFNGARTGRWAGRAVQLQNLPRNYVEPLEDINEDFRVEDFIYLAAVYGDEISNIQSQLIRTMFVPKIGHTFAVADFSAIEARVIAWLAGEKWRLDVFATHGKIYEASAASMFKIDIEDVTQEQRARGKVCELALGYQGAKGALAAMGAEKMGMSVDMMDELVTSWRAANPAIKRLWNKCNAAAILAVTHKTSYTINKGIIFDFDGKTMTIKLPSGRKLYYQDVTLGSNKWGQPNIKYKGYPATARKWCLISTYGGKLVENIVQAIARDILVVSMRRLSDAGYKICMHVHDEAVVEVKTEIAETECETICEIMGSPIDWADGLPSDADGYISPFYRK